MSKAKKTLKSVAKKVVKKVKKEKKFGAAPRAPKKIEVLSEKEEAKIAVALEDSDKLKDDDLRKIIQTSKVHHAEANRILEGRKAEKKLNKNLSA